MTITKAFALAALTGTLAIGPQAAFAQSTEHRNSEAAHTRNDGRKAAREDKVDFGRVISTIRTGGDVTIDVVNLDEVLHGNNQVALENALT